MEREQSERQISQERLTIASLRRTIPRKLGGYLVQQSMEIGARFFSIVKSCSMTVRILCFR